MFLQEMDRKGVAIDNETISTAYLLGRGLLSLQHTVTSLLPENCKEKFESFCSGYLILRACYYKICNTEKYKSSAFLEKTTALNQACCADVQAWYETIQGEV